MAVDAVEATESLPKEAGLVGLDGPLDELDLTKMLVENFEDNGPEETSSSGDAVEEAEPVEELTEEVGRRFRNQLLRKKSLGIKLELIHGLPPFCGSPPYETFETNI